MNAPEHRPLLPALVARDRIIAVLRAPDSTYLIDVALALAEEGIGCIEVTLTTAGAIESIHTLRSRLDDDACAVGAGSVLTVGDLEAAHSAGATYTLAPTLDLDVLSRAHQLGIAHVPGVATPTEALTAWRAGVAAVKVFPASQARWPKLRQGAARAASGHQADSDRRGRTGRCHVLPQRRSRRRRGWRPAHRQRPHQRPRRRLP